MKPQSNFVRLDLSRRRVLSHGALLAGGAAVFGASLAASSVQAATKVSQKVASYQPTPQGKARCDGCTQWQTPASCKLVSGAISPSGWCSLYAPKPKS